MSHRSLLTPAEVAEMVRVSTKTLQKMRQRGDGPSFVKIRRKVLYPPEEIAAYVQRNVFRSTSEYPST
jgi:predicted DNA-binding transcriptional regulator AlpA